VKRLVLTLLLVLSACDARSMRDQAKHEPYEHTTFFGDETVMRPVVRGTVPALDIVQWRRLRAGLEPGSLRASNDPRALIERGRERFGVFCTPCHGLDGHGRGMVVTRGFPAPPSLHEPRLLRADGAHFVRVMTRGLGKMPSYAAQVPPADRWLIAAYVKVLQMSQRATVALVPPDELERLMAREESTP
jgi:mono/diheme cytochrome c family protein